MWSQIQKICPRQIRLISSNTRKRIYENVEIEERDLFFHIKINKKRMKLPNGKLFSLTNRTIASAVAMEWQVQRPIFNPSQMPMTQICQQIQMNPLNLEKEDLIEICLNYLETDTILYGNENDSDSFKEQQQRLWHGPINLINRELGLSLPYYQKNSPLNILTVKSSVSERDNEMIKNFLFSNSREIIHAILLLTETLKSLLLSLSLILQKDLSVEHIVESSLLEQMFQTKQWGEVEWYHTIQYYDLITKVSSIYLYILSSFQQTKIIKNLK
ncbi:hypothetical protein SNEBB_004220 [Seison nebaliae]|nr:hypothetical protein SNEBB_004220 [Seison nebaliae]